MFGLSITACQLEFVEKLSMRSETRWRSFGNIHGYLDHPANNGITTYRQSFFYSCLLNGCTLRYGGVDLERECCDESSSMRGLPGRSFSELISVRALSALLTSFPIAFPTRYPQPADNVCTIQPSIIFFFPFLTVPIKKITNSRRREFSSARGSPSRDEHEWCWSYVCACASPEKVKNWKSADAMGRWERSGKRSTRDRAIELAWQSQFTLYW